MTSTDARRCWSTQTRFRERISPRRAHRPRVRACLSRFVALMPRGASAANDAARFGRAFRVESFEIAVAVVDVLHRRGNRAVSGLLRDESVHRLGNATV